MAVMVMVPSSMGQAAGAQELDTGWSVTRTLRSQKATAPSTFIKPALATVIWPAFSPMATMPPELLSASSSKSVSPVSGSVAATWLLTLLLGLSREWMGLDA